MGRINPYLPQDGEETSVYVYEIVQEILTGDGPPIEETISAFRDMPEGAYPPPLPGFENLSKPTDASIPVPISERMDWNWFEHRK